MADPITPTPNPTPDPTPKPKRTRGDVNTAHLTELKNTRTVADSARDPRYVQALATVDLDLALLTQIGTLAGQLDDAFAKLKTARVGKGTMTAQEVIARDALIALLGPIQTAAKRAFSGDQKNERDAYYIGAGLSTQTLDEVLVAAGNILARLTPGANNTPPQDTLPGIKADPQIKVFAAAIETYGGKDKAQADQQNLAAGTLEDIDGAITDLAALRRKVQLAADQAWPWRTDGVATIRKAFLLPTDRQFTD